MHWHVKNQPTKTNLQDRLKEIISLLLKNRHITTKEQAQKFLQPQNPIDLPIEELAIDAKQLNTAISRIQKAIKNNHIIVIFGDYDADGITATAVMWETLHKLGAKVKPFIPHREKHGYGLSIKAIDDVILEQNPDLIITVDNGIVAHEAADYVAGKGIDLIITDHHAAAETLPTAQAVVHTTKLAGAGVSWITSREIAKQHSSDNWQEIAQASLDLATIGTVADQVPLIEANRSLVAFGIKALRQSNRIGLKELFVGAQFNQKELNTYHINFVLAPRINAMGRLAHGLDSLRLLCTKNQVKAKELAQTLGNMNQTRQDLTFELLQKAHGLVVSTQDNIIVVDDPDFHEGVIGLVAGKLTESHYRPSIVIGRGESVSKASARSVVGVNIIQLIRKTEHLLLNAGGHPMAAGFTISTDNIELFKKTIIDFAKQDIDPSLLTPSLEVDCEIELGDISWGLQKSIHKLEPFGSENPKPLFLLKGIQVLEKMTIGREAKHLKLILPSKIDSQPSIDALWFGKGDQIDQVGNQVDLVFSIDQNTWNGKSKLQLMIKDLH